jgi:hypothetical protein
VRLAILDILAAAVRKASACLVEGSVCHARRTKHLSERSCC